MLHVLHVLPVLPVLPVLHVLHVLHVLLVLLPQEKPEWHEVVEKRILMPTFVGEDDLMWPHDPLGRGGPSLDQFLNF